MLQQTSECFWKFPLSQKFEVMQQDRFSYRVIHQLETTKWIKVLTAATNKEESPGM